MDPQKQQVCAKDKAEPNTNLHESQLEQALQEARQAKAEAKEESKAEGAAKEESTAEEAKKEDLTREYPQACTSAASAIGPVHPWDLKILLFSRTNAHPLPLIRQYL